MSFTLESNYLARGKKGNLLAPGQRAFREVENTARDLLNYSISNLTRIADDLGFDGKNQFINYLNGKVVIDCGSGFNGLAIDALLHGVNTQIVSVTPAMQDHLFIPVQEKVVRSSKESLFPDFSDNDIELARRKSLEGSYPFLAHELLFEDDAFDAVIDNYASSFYTSFRNRQVYGHIVVEQMRVLKKGGELRIGDREMASEWNGDPPHWRAQIIRELGWSPIFYEFGVVVGKE